MYTLYRHTMNLFVRSKLMLILYSMILISLIVGSIVPLTFPLDFNAAFSLAELMVRPLIIYVLLFVVIGYELTLKLYTNKTSGYLAAHDLGLLKAYFAIIACLITIIILPFVMFLMAVIVAYYHHGFTYYPPFLNHMIMISVLYFGGSLTIGSFLGAAMAAKFKTKRLAAYSLTVALFMLNTASFVEIPFRIPYLLFGSYQAEKVLYYIKDFFTLVPYELDGVFMVYPIYGFPMEPIRWILAIFWLVFLPLLIFSECFRRSVKKAVSVAALLVVSLAVGLFSFRGSTVAMDRRVESLPYADPIYYMDRPQENYRDHEAGFTITEYLMELTIGNELHAQVEVTVDNSNLPNYEFTLYRGYILKSVHTEGDDVPFTREGDFVSIGGLKGADRLVFEYYGKSPKYYANQQAVTLPGYFAYYPKAGRTNIFDLDRYGYVINLSSSESYYTVDIQSSSEIFCNLPGGDNSFSGRSNAVSLFAGMYDEIAEGIYAEPIRQPQRLPKREYILEAERILIEVFDRLDREMPFEEISDKKYFLVPETFVLNSGTEEVVIMSDHITSSLSGKGETIAIGIMNFVTAKAEKIPWTQFRWNYVKYLSRLPAETATETQKPVDISLLLEEIAEWQSLDARMVSIEEYRRLSEEEKALHRVDRQRRRDLGRTLGENTPRYLFWESPRKEENLRIFYDYFTLAGGDGQVGVVELVQRLLREELGS